jgi:hypothetical protein
MSSLVRLGPGKSGGPMGISSHGLDHTILTTQMRSLRFKAGNITRIGGQHDGEVVEGEVPANARVHMTPITPLNPRRYEMIISYNPELLKYGSVCCPPMIGPGRGDEVILHFHAAKKIDLSKFDYIFELSMID